MLELNKLCDQFAALMTQMKEEKHEEAAKTADVITAILQAAKAGGDDNGQINKLLAQNEQMRKDLNATIEEVRKVKSMGLGIESGRIVLAGRSSRIDMLKDDRAFVDDAVARRFGASFIGSICRRNKSRISFDELPRATKDLFESVQEKATADLDPGTSGAGLELVSNEFRAELIRNVEAVGVAFPLCNRVPLSTTGTTTWPKRTGGLTAYPTAIAAKIRQSGITFGTVTMQPEKWGTLTGVPGEMFRDPTMLADVGNLVGVEIVHAMAYAADNAILNGDGTADYGGITGVFQSATIASAAPVDDHDEMSEITAADVGYLAGQLAKDYALPNARLLHSLTVHAHFRNLRNAATGLPLYDRGSQNEPANIDGWPYTICNRAPAYSTIGAAAKFAAFGDFRMALYWGTLRRLMIDASEDVWFDQDMVAVRGLSYWDMGEADSDAILTWKTHA